MYLLALAAVPIWCRVSRIARIALIALVPYVVVIATYRVWWGEWGPPARYLVPIAPFAAGALAVAIRRLRTPGRVAAVCLWGTGMLLMLVGAFNPQRLYHHPNGVNNLYTALDETLGTDIAARLVAFQPFAQSSLGPRTGIAIVFLAVLTAVVLAVGVPTARMSSLRNRVDRPYD